MNGGSSANGLLVICAEIRAEMRSGGGHEAGSVPATSHSPPPPSRRRLALVGQGRQGEEPQAAIRRPAVPRDSTPPVVLPVPCT